MNITDANWFGSLEQMLADLPENRPLYKDSGRWSIRSEDLQIVFAVQLADEDFPTFIKRAYDAENIYTS